MLYTVIGAVCAYLIGSIPFAIVTSKLFGLQDPRQFGSGNPGATNVLRSGNKTAAALTLVGDALKGWIAVFIAQKYTSLPDVGIAVVALAVFLGHIYSVFLGFKGGKGVATAIGVLIALDATLALSLVGIWLLMAILFRYSSLAAIVAASVAPILYLIMNLQSVHYSNAIFIAILFMSAMLVYKHKTNIEKLLKGTESKIGGKKKDKLATHVAPSTHAKGRKHHK
ncbi:glycerol-3-phosphate 1-O-acyltransferase PlsY [Pelistega europaea]|uniref:Glycerol-3-phosphate acyltransferase n=1 Tax=Pelistega europaea TaxID=106147 RepID=A0A7Y4LCA4_9BURK|nr:glycerol-3-phosphate 1-O-acyltransferase PlsY [Pelistega europaea]NOL49646.1 glycerol-3-phosphate 1-O-acyltransferase PlsY [Pelistega europaea]